MVDSREQIHTRKSGGESENKSKSRQKENENIRKDGKKFEASAMKLSPIATFVKEKRDEFGKRSKFHFHCRCIHLDVSERSTRKPKKHFILFCIFHSHRSSHDDSIRRSVNLFALQKRRKMFHEIDIFYDNPFEFYLSIQS